MSKQFCVYTPPGKVWESLRSGKWTKTLSGPGAYSFSHAYLMLTEGLEGKQTSNKYGTLYRLVDAN